jgi:multidrug efflux pump subunit AcrA (membrane-fusion protein)
MIAGMYVSGHVRAEAYHAPSLPAEAVVRQGGEQYVYVRTGQHAGHWTFRRRRVKTGARRAGRVEIRNPAALPADSSLVVSGAHALLGEQLKGAGHGHHH